MKNITIEEKKKFLKENNLTHLVRELACNGDVEDAIEWVYDSKTLTKDEFKKKYFG